MCRHIFFRDSIYYSIKLDPDKKYVWIVMVMVWYYLNKNQKFRLLVAIMSTKLKKRRIFISSNQEILMKLKIKNPFLITDSKYEKNFEYEAGQNHLKIKQYHI